VVVPPVCPGVPCGWLTVSSGWRLPRQAAINTKITTRANNIKTFLSVFLAVIKIIPPLNCLSSTSNLQTKRHRFITQLKYTRYHTTENKNMQAIFFEFSAIAYYKIIN
jgi:hypothetical protein